jgi:hypothetical protein
MEIEHVASVCPPHHWLITNELTEQGSLELWICQRCGGTRERAIARRRGLGDSTRRFIGSESSDIGSLLGPSGERVA